MGFVKHLRAIVLVAILSLSLLSCGKEHRTSFNSTIQENVAENKNVIPSDNQSVFKPFPAIPEGKYTNSVVRNISQFEFKTTGEFPIASIGKLNKIAENDPHAYAIVADKDTPLAYAQFCVSHLTTYRPVSVKFDLIKYKPLDEVENLPLHYYIGIANFTKYSWEWNGPYTDKDNTSIDLIINSKLKQDRYVDKIGALHFVIITSTKDSPSLSKLGRVGVAFKTSVTTISPDYIANNPHYTPIKEIFTGNKVISSVTTQNNPLSFNNPLTTKLDLLQSTSTSLNPQQYVTILWDHIFAFGEADKNDEAFAYQIFRKCSFEDKDIMIGSINTPYTFFNDPPTDVMHISSIPGPTPGAINQYYLRAISPKGGYTPKSAMKSIIPQILPPDNFQASGNNSYYVELSWNAANGAREYEIWASDNQNDPKIKLLVTVPAPTGSRVIFKDTSIENGKVRYYRIKSIGYEKTAKEGVSVFSNEDMGFKGPDQRKMFGLDPTHSNRSPYIGSNTNELKWSFETEGYAPGEFWSTPAIAANGTVYVSNHTGIWAFHSNGNKKWSITGSIYGNRSPVIGSDGTIYIDSDGGTLYAINPDGTQKWSYTTGGYINSSPTISIDGTIYIVLDDDNLYAINPDGTKKWSYNAGSFINTLSIDANGLIYISSGLRISAINTNGTKKWSYHNNSFEFSTPAISTDGTVYVGSQDGNIYALNPDGTYKWSIDSWGSMNYSSPAIGNDGIIYFGGWGGYLYAINPDSSLKWKFRAYGRFVSSPRFGSDGTIIVGGRGNNIYAVNPDGTQKWSYDSSSEFYCTLAIGKDDTIFVGSDYDFYALNFDGTKKWSISSGNKVNSSPLISSDGTIYIGSNRTLYALNQSGSKKWSFETGGVLSSTPATGIDGTIYIGCKDTYLYAINSDGTKKWMFGTGSKIETSPNIGADGTIYINNVDGKLFAINPNGTKKWSIAGEFGLISSPVIGMDGTIYLITDQGYLYAINPDGTKKWLYYSVSFSSHELNESLSIGDNGTIYYGSTNRNLYAINPNGILKWSIDLKCYLHSMAINSDGTIYVGTTDDSLIAIDSEGHNKWSYPTGKCVKASPTIGADGSIYIGCSDNSVSAINPDGTKKWSYATGGAINSSPVIGADGTIYIGSDDGKLYAIGSGTGKTSLEPPINISASDNTDPYKIFLTWDAPSSGPVPDGYYIYQSLNTNGVWQLIGNTTSKSFDDTIAESGKTYFYKVQSYKSASGYNDSPDSVIDSGSRK